MGIFSNYYETIDIYVPERRIYNNNLYETSGNLYLYLMH